MREVRRPRSRRVLVLSHTTGYQLRAFNDAAEALGIELVFATDRCHRLDDPWQDRAVPVRFYDLDASLELIVRRAPRVSDCRRDRGRRSSRAFSRRARRRRSGIRWHSVAGAHATTDKRHSRAPWPSPDCRPRDSSRSSRERDRDSGRRRRPRRFPVVLKPAGPVRQPWRHPRRRRRASSRRRSSASARCSRGPQVRAARDGPRGRDPRRELHRRARVRGGRGADRRGAAGVRDLRQARSARGAVLRRDDLRDAVAGLRGACRGASWTHVQRAARRSGLARPDPRRVPRHAGGKFTCWRSPRGRSAGCARAC